MAEKTRREILLGAFDEDQRVDTNPDEGTDGLAGGEQADASQSSDVPDVSAGAADSGEAGSEKAGAEKDPKIKWSDSDKKKPEVKDPYDKEKRAADKPDDKAKQKVSGKEGTPKDSATKDDGKEVKAPNSWTPAERETWKGVPRAAQLAVQRREQQIQRTLSETATIRKFSTDLANVIAPHSHILRAQGATPLMAIDNLMKTSSGLATGSSAQKANIVAQICRNFHVDMKELDNALADVFGVTQQGQPAGGVDKTAVSAAVMEAMKPFSSFMSTVQSRAAEREQEIQQTSAQQADDFCSDPANEFADDLADEMADLLEISAKRGRKMTLPQAYQAAIRNNPEIEAIVNQRKAAGRSNSPQNIDRARRAASSIRGAPSGAGAGGGTGPKSRRDHLMAALDGQNG
jgi:hypothetical protein